MGSAPRFNGSRARADTLAHIPGTAEWPACELCDRPSSEWELDVCDPDPKQEGTLEALLTLGNGYFATRGAAVEHSADGVHYPGTYIAGIYNRLRSGVGDDEREDESIVNLPNWLAVHLRSRDGELIARAVHDHRVLDMRRGILRREVHGEDRSGRRSVIREIRLISMRRPHAGFLRIVVTPVDWSGELCVESSTDGEVRNDNVASFRGLAADHLDVVEARSDPNGTSLLVAETTQSCVRVAVATRTRIDGAPPAQTLDADGVARLRWDLRVTQAAPVAVHKTVSLFTSRDRAITEPSAAARRELEHAPDLRDAIGEHETEWRHIWSRLRLEVSPAGESAAESVGIQRAIDTHIFHTAQTLSRHTSEGDVGIPARGLHGEAYRGHVFWDELFVFPFLNLRMPELTRALLLYRYRRLTEARRIAESIGDDGALFPWQSGSDGREETPVSFYNPLADDWIPDHSLLQFHVGLAVAYNTWHYFQVTGDMNFLASFGAELLVEIARFWSSRAEHDPRTGRHHLRGMMGPDEFHDGFPDRAGSGIDDNAYVAVMAAWLFSTVIRAHDTLGGDSNSDLWQRLGLEDEELIRWRMLSRTLYVPFLANGLLAQFEGYGDLEEFDFEGYRARYGDIGRLDLILAAEGDSPNRYKVSKQADVLMLFYLFSAEELSAIFERLGYDFDPQTIPDTIAYYLARTTHGSTLSRVVHAWVLARGDRRAAWELLREALGTDLRDIQGGTTREGIHLGAMAATADILQRCFTGLEVREDTIFLHPQLPEALKRLTCELRYRGHWLTLTVTHETVTLTSRAHAAPTIAVVIEGEALRLEGGATVRRRLPGR
ncbi:glycoside hydrolase family 65 protein [Microbacterium immunditiarum]|uniref:Trehalose/maltose hydrolase-like predicted phosphorylase n=1 Tax=Microbacterium immunditiarum TaxID=337480 RepID=A0A7Y9GNE7_9MICO|nr:glycoside hydrolase family 65 protein [Microbacterium immunditiarum]NYE19708.1 trehalose/maltose hydrolase-like predicted phosphorylase [Microbacterium immunditiarum]